MSGLWSVLEKLWLKHCKCKCREDPYSTITWNNFDDYSMEIVGASNLLDEIFSNKLIKLFFLVSRVDLAIFVGKLFQAMLIPIVIIEMCTESWPALKAVRKWGDTPHR